MSLGYGSGLGLEDVGLSKGTTAGAIFFGSLTSYVMYGVAACQVISYFRTYPKDTTTLKLHVALVWIMETTNVFLMTPAVWYYLIRRGADTTFEQFIFCNDWTLMAQAVPTEICCLLVEIFFITRMWRLDDSKFMVILTMVPFLTGWGFNIAYCVGMFRVRCYPDFKVNNVWLFASYGSRIASDGLIAGTMCYVLWRKRPDSIWKTNTLRVISYLCLWALTTGLLMWMSAVAFVVTYLITPTSLVSPGVYLMRGRIHSNTMLAVLNSRQHIRQLMNESIPLDVVQRTEGPPHLSLPNDVGENVSLDHRRRQTYYVPETGTQSNSK